MNGFNINFLLSCWRGNVTKRVLDVDREKSAIQCGRLGARKQLTLKKFWFFRFFLVAPSHLYKRSCPSVRWSVGPSVCSVLFSKVKNTHTRRIFCRVSGLVTFSSDMIYCFLKVVASFFVSKIKAVELRASQSPERATLRIFLSWRTKSTAL